MMEKNCIKNGKKKFDRRANKRFDLSLGLSLYDRNVKTKNISATGVYFEVLSDGIDSFSLGSTISFLITGEVTTEGLSTIKINFYGNGIIIRSNTGNITSDSNLLGIAVEFVERLYISDCFAVKDYNQIEDDILNYLKRR